MFARQTRLRSLACGLTLLVAPQAMAATFTYEPYTYYAYSYVPAKPSVHIEPVWDADGSYTGRYAISDWGETTGYLDDPLPGWEMQPGFGFGFFFSGHGTLDLSGQTLEFGPQMSAALASQVDDHGGLYLEATYYSTATFAYYDPVNGMFRYGGNMVGSFSFGDGNLVTGWQAHASLYGSPEDDGEDEIAISSTGRPFDTFRYTYEAGTVFPDRPIHDFYGSDTWGGLAVTTRPGYWRLNVQEGCVMRYDSGLDYELFACPDAPPPAPVPLPASAVFLIGALGGLGLVARRRRAG